MNTSRSPQKPVLKHAAFTLIELLVVISIIIILAGLSIGAMSGVMQTAKKTSAKNDLVAIVTAVKAYYTDYGRYPLASTVQDDASAVFGAPNKPTNEKLINVLRYSTDSVPAWADDATTPLNPRQTRYLEVPRAKDLGSPKSGLNAAGAWFDPWGVPYVVFMDGDYNNDIEVGSCFTSGLGSPSAQTKVSITVGAASVGYDQVVMQKKLPTVPFGAKAFNQSADLLSWR